ncbi:hypothetical protein ACHAWT_000038 [Skeletonema menzelii]
MKTYIYIALFTTLIAASHHMKVSAADAIDGASHPHLRALADAAVDVACSNGGCNNDNQCGNGEKCADTGGVGCCVGVVIRCPASHCYSDGHGCPEGTSCDTSAEDSQNPGCYECRADNEDESEATSLRASFLKEE